MHKEYQKLIQYVNDPIQRHKIIEYYSNTSYVSALRCLTTCGNPPMPTSQDCLLSAPLGHTTTTISQVAQENNQLVVQCEGAHLHLFSIVPLPRSDTTITTPPPLIPACLTSVGTNLVVKLPGNNLDSEPCTMEGVAAGMVTCPLT